MAREVSVKHTEGDPYQTEGVLGASLVRRVDCAQYAPCRLYIVRGPRLSARNKSQQPGFVGGMHSDASPENTHRQDGVDGVRGDGGFVHGCVGLRVGQRTHTAGSEHGVLRFVPHKVQILLVVHLQITALSLTRQWELAVRLIYDTSYKLGDRVRRAEFDFELRHSP